MKFKNIFLITIILLAIFSLSFVSAENITDNNELESIDSDVISEDIVSTNLEVNDDIVQENSTDAVSDTNSTSNVTDENTTESSIESADLVKYYKNDTQYEVTFYDNDGNKLVNQTVYFNINGANYNRTTNDDGLAKFSINLRPGNYIIKATNPVTNESVSNNVTVLSTLSSINVIKSYKNDTQYYVTLFDGQGSPLTNTNVTLNINGVFYNRTTNTNGVAKLNINLIPGKYIITAENTYNGDQLSNNITVVSTINGKDIKKYYKNATQYYVNFTDNQGNALANTSVTFNINGVFYSRTTNANGTARLNINLNSGKYVLTATNPVSGEEKSNTIEVLSKISVKNSNSGGNVSIEYNNNGKFSVDLYYDNGTLAKNENVTFNINGVLYTRTSNENGTASLAINLNPGDYIITSEFEGCKISNTIKVRITPSVTLITTSVKVNNPIQFRLTEKNTGNPITGEHYGILYYNGTTYGAYPDSTGLVSIGQQLPAGSYLFYFGTIDDGYYSSILNGNTIKVVE